MFNLSYNISFSIAALAIAVILLLIVILNYSTSNIVNKRYKYLLISAIVMIALNIVTVVTNDNAAYIPELFNMALNGLYFFSGAVVAVFFLYYCISISLRESKPSHKKAIYIVSVTVLGLYLISLIVNNWTGFYFHYENNVYTGGPAYIFVNAVSLLYIFYAIGMLIVKRKMFNINQLICTALFFLSFIVSFVLQLTVFKTTLLSDFGCALGILIVFFSIETPDYVKLTKTLDELNELKASLEIQVANRTLELDNEKKSYEELTLETLSSLARMIDAKDHYTVGHSFRVASYAKALAQELGKSYQECEQIYFAGLIHDVGKIGINESILTKPGKLTDEEYETIKAHSTLGGDILKGNKKFPIFEQVARSHHERYDGRGYPDKLKGEGIPFEARIVSVCDSFDAMTSDRSYRKALSDKVAIKELIDNKGTQFDPELVDAFLRVIDKYPDSIKNHVDEIAQEIINNN